MDDFALDHYAFVADIKRREEKTEKDRLHKYRCTISHQSCYKLLPNDSLLPFQFANCQSMLLHYGKKSHHN